EALHLPRVAEVGDEEVAPLADLRAHDVPRDALAEVREGLDPAVGVEVVGVNEGAVDVEDHSAEGHEPHEARFSPNVGRPLRLARTSLMVTRPSLLLLLVLAAAARAAAQPALVLVPLASGFDRPVQVVSAHDGSGALHVAQQGGKILRLDPATGARELFLDLSA